MKEMKANLFSAVFSAVLFSLVGATALAQAKTGTSNSTSTSNASSNSASNSAVTSTATTSAAPAAASSTASLPTAAAKAQPSKFSFRISTLQSIGQTTLTSGGLPSTENVIAAGYKLSDTQTIALRQVFGYAYPKAGKSGRATMGDTHVQFANSKVATLPGEWGVSGMLRVALPTGESSRFTHRRKGYFLGTSTAAKTIGRTDLSFTVVGIYFNSPDASYMSSGKLISNPQSELDQYGTIGYNLTDDLSVFQSIGTTNIFHRSAPGAATRTQSFDLSTGVSYSLKPFSVIGTIDNNVNIWDNSQAFSLYSKDDITYTLSVAASM